MKFQCTMLPPDSNEPCKNKPVKNSIYCKVHNYIMKHNKSKTVPCLQCDKGTSAKYQICVPCGGHEVGLKYKYIDVIKPWGKEIARLNRIHIYD